MSLLTSARGVASAALAAALFISAAHSQALIQAGPTTAGHIPQYFTQGTSQAVVGDGGGAGGGVLNANPSEFGITSRGPTYPVVGGGNGPNGEHFCMYDAPTVNVGGYHALCFDPNSPLDGGGGLFSYGAYGGAAAGPLEFYINGTIVNLTGLLGTITVGTTNVAGGSNGSMLYDNGGKLGELPLAAGVPASLAIQPNVTGGFAQYPVAASTLTGTVPVAQGGTGATSFAGAVPLIGNGTGAIATGTKSGTTSEFATVQGIPVNGDCASWNQGNVIDAGSACGSGSGGSGTVSAGTAGQIAVYASSGTTVSGASGVTFKQGGIPCDTLENHGGGPAASGSTNTTAWNNVIGNLSSTGGCIQFNAGQYTFASVLSASPGPSATVGVFGLGPRATVLSFPSGGGISDAPQDITSAMVAGNFSMKSGDSSGATSAITVTGASTGAVGTKSTFFNIEMTGDGVGGFWKWGYVINNVAGTDIYSPSINGLGSVSPAGGGVLCQGAAPSSTTGYTTDLTVANPIVTGATVAFQMGSYCQDFTVQNMNVSGGGNAVAVPTGSGTFLGLHVLGGSVTSMTSSPILLTNQVSGVFVQGLRLAVAASQTGIFVGPAQGGSISGNDILCGSTSSSAGIGANGSFVSIIGNVIGGCGAGVSLGGTASNNNIQSNIYNGNTNKAISSSPSANNFGSCTGVSGSCTAGATP